MSPAEIKSIRHIANGLTESSPLTRFVLLWIVWEATRTRLLVIACRKQGWRMGDARKVLAAKRNSSGRSFSQNWSKLTNTNLDTLPGDAGRVWKALQGVEQMRHRIVHGFSKHAPEYLASCAAVLEKALDAMPHTLGAVEVTDRDGAKHTIGDPLIAFKGSKNTPGGYRETSELAALLAVKKLAAGNGKLPKAAQLDQWILQGFGSPPGGTETSGTGTRTRPRQASIKRNKETA